jgi:hypothetical protein
MAQLPIESWQANSPFPIESTLAQGMMDPAKAGVAAALMAGYQSMRQGNSEQYRQDVAGNRALMAQQIQTEARNKAIVNAINAMKIAAENPGALQAMQSNPLLANTLSGDANAYSNMAQILMRNNQIQNLQRAGSGASGLSSAGFRPQTNDLSELIGMQLKDVPRSGEGSTNTTGIQEYTLYNGAEPIKLKPRPGENEEQFIARANLTRQLAAAKTKAERERILEEMGYRSGNATPSEQQRAIGR